MVLLLLAMAFGLGGRPVATRSRRAALLGSATGISWGFVAAIIKELSSHIDDGIGAVFANWSLYALLTVGAAAMLLASHALAAGPLAASQPGFTVLDPLSAGLLGVFLFGEQVSTGVLDLAGEALALAVVIAGAIDPQPQLPDPRRGRAVAGALPAVRVPGAGRGQAVRVRLPPGPGTRRGRDGAAGWQPGHGARG